MRLNKSNIFIVGFITSIALCQCTPSKYNLIDYKHYSNDILSEHITYQYKNADLYLSTTEWYSQNGDSSRVFVCFTEYDSIMSDSGVVHIETSYSTSLPGGSCDTSKTFKYLDLYGVIQSIMVYTRESGFWKLSHKEQYDDNGLLRYKADERHKGLRYWYSYDSLDRYLGMRTLDYRLDSLDLEVISLIVDTIIYSDDGRNAVLSHFKIENWDSIQEIKSPEQLEFDKHGRKRSQKVGDSFKKEFSYDKKGRIKNETSYTRVTDKSKLKKIYRTTYHYRRGLLTKIKDNNYDVKYKYRSYVTLYKYDFKNKLLLEQVGLGPDRKVQSRKVWTYSIAWQK